MPERTVHASRRAIRKAFGGEASDLLAACAQSVQVLMENQRELLRRIEVLEAKRPFWERWTQGKPPDA